MLRWLTQNGYLHLDSRGGSGGGSGSSSATGDTTTTDDDGGTGGDDDGEEGEGGADGDGDDADDAGAAEFNDAEKAFLLKAGVKAEDIASLDADTWQKLWRATFDDRGVRTAENNKLQKDLREANKKASSAESRYASLDLKELLGSETPTKEQLQEIAKRLKVGDNLAKRATLLKDKGLIPEPVLELLTTGEDDPIAISLLMDEAKKSMRKPGTNGNGAGDDDVDPVMALFQKHGLRKKGTPRGRTAPGDPEKRAQDLLKKARGQDVPPNADPTDYYAAIAEKNKQS